MCQRPIFHEARESNGLNGEIILKSTAAFSLNKQRASEYCHVAQEIRLNPISLSLQIH